MTPDQLTRLEAELARRGYKKWTNCLIGKEDYAWFKSFGIHKDADGDLDRDYQIAFRITDWMSRDPRDRPERASVGVTVTMLPSGLNNRIDVDYSLQLEVPDIDLCERMFQEMYDVIKKYEI